MSTLRSNSLLPLHHKHPTVSFASSVHPSIRLLASFAILRSRRHVRIADRGASKRPHQKFQSSQLIAAQSVSGPKDGLNVLHDLSGKCSCKAWNLHTHISYRTQTRRVAFQATPVCLRHLSVYRTVSFGLPSLDLSFDLEKPPACSAPFCWHLAYWCSSAFTPLLCQPIVANQRPTNTLATVMPMWN